MKRKYKMVIIFLMIATAVITGVYFTRKHTHQEDVIQAVYYDGSINKISVLNGHTGEKNILDQEKDVLLIADIMTKIPLIAVDEEPISVDGFAYLITIEGDVHMYFSSYEKVKMGDKSYMFRDEDDYDHLINRMINLIE